MTKIRTVSWDVKQKLQHPRAHQESPLNSFAGNYFSSPVLLLQVLPGTMKHFQILQLFFCAAVVTSAPTPSPDTPSVPLPPPHLERALPISACGSNGVRLSSSTTGLYEIIMLLTDRSLQDLLGRRVHLRLPNTRLYATRTLRCRMYGLVLTDWEQVQRTAERILSLAGTESCTLDATALRSARLPASEGGRRWADAYHWRAGLA